jgi:hypothetical protein
MPNELFGSVGFALSADRRRPKTLARRLTIKERNRQATAACEKFGEAWCHFEDRVFLILGRQFHQSTCESPGKLTDPQGPLQKRVCDGDRD